MINWPLLTTSTPIALVQATVPSPWTTTAAFELSVPVLGPLRSTCHRTGKKDAFKGGEVRARHSTAQNPTSEVPSSLWKRAQSPVTHHSRQGPRWSGLSLPAIVFAHILASLLVLTMSCILLLRVFVLPLPLAPGCCSSKYPQLLNTWCLRSGPEGVLMWQESLSEMVLPSRTASWLTGACDSISLEVWYQIRSLILANLIWQYNPLCLVCRVQDNLKFPIYVSVSHCVIETPWRHRVSASSITAPLALRTKPDTFWFKNQLYHFLWAQQYSGYDYISYTVSSCSCKT